MFANTAQMFIAAFYGSYVLFTIAYLLIDKEGFLRFSKWFSIDVMAMSQDKSIVKLTGIYLLRNAIGMAVFGVGIYFEPMFTIVTMAISIVIGMIAVRLAFGKNVLAKTLG